MNFREMYLHGEIYKDMDIVDAHAHIGIFPGTSGREGSAESLCRMMAKINVKTSVISSSNAIKGDFVSGNDDVAKAVSQYDDKLLGYVTLNPNHTDGVLEEIGRLSNKKNMVGIKIHPDHSQMSVLREEYQPGFRFANETGGIVLVHTWSCNAVDELQKIIEKYEGAKFIIAHSGAATGYKLTAEIIKTHDNAYCDIATGSPWANALEYLVTCGSDDKILYGTDTVLVDPRIVFGRIMLTDISDESKVKIMGANARKLFADAKL